MSTNDAEGVWLSNMPELASNDLSGDEGVVGGLEPLLAPVGLTEAVSATSGGVRAGSTDVDLREVASALLQEVLMAYLNDDTCGESISAVLSFLSRHGCLTEDLRVDVSEALRQSPLDSLEMLQGVSAFIHSLVYEVFVWDAREDSASQVEVGVAEGGSSSSESSSSGDDSAPDHFPRSNAFGDDLGVVAHEEALRSLGGNLGADSGVFEEEFSEVVDDTPDSGEELDEELGEGPVKQGFTRWYVLASEDGFGVSSQGDDLRKSPPSLVLMDEDGGVVLADLVLTERTAEELHEALGRLLALYQGSKEESLLKRVSDRLTLREWWSGTSATLREHKWLRRFTYGVLGVAGVVMVYGVAVISGVV